MEYPVDCITPGDKTEYLYKAQELLRIVHNVFVTWRDDGLTEAEHTSLIPSALKKKWTFKGNITPEECSRFIKEDFTPRSETLQEGILAQRAAFKTSVRWSIDVGEVEKLQR